MFSVFCIKVGFPHKPNFLHISTVFFVLGLHFHLSATINAVGDIPLVPAMSTGTSSNGNQNKNFVLHWMNNKEMEFNLQVNS
jgi:hypothetical protein